MARPCGHRVVQSISAPCRRVSGCLGLRVSAGEYKARGRTSNKEINLPCSEPLLVLLDKVRGAGNQKQSRACQVDWPDV
jgi:hypothetical protein